MADGPGFVIPHRYADAVSPCRYPALMPIFEAARPRMLELLDAIDGFAPALKALRGPPPQPRFDQDWFPRLDAAALYTLVRTRRPRRVVEIGSGHSTRFAARAVADGGSATEIVCFDPEPRASLAGLSLDHRPALMQDAVGNVAGLIGPGDVLFVDSSHVLMPGTDVDLLLNAVLPSLPSASFVHFHDVFLPEPYPETWRWRGYNEQSALAALIQGGGYEVLFASRWLRAMAPEMLAGRAVMRLPLVPGAYECSLWLQKRS